MGLTDEEFSRQYYALPTYLQKLQLAIREDRYTIWARNDGKPNSSDVYLMPVLDLPDTHEVKVKRPRLSGGDGTDFVVVLEYTALIMGKEIPIYLKAYFGNSEGLIVDLQIQSLRPKLTLVEEV